VRPESILRLSALVIACAGSTHAADVTFSTGTFTDNQSYDNGNLGPGNANVVTFDTGANYSFSGNLTLPGAWNRVHLNTGTSLNVAGSLTVDISGISLNGGSLTTGGLYLHDSPGWNGTINDGKQTVEYGDSVFNGSTIIANQSNALFISKAPTPAFPESIGNGLWLNGDGVTIDTNGHDIGISMNMGGSGGLTKSGSGTLTIAAANTYTGNTTINAGALKIAEGTSIYNGGYNNTSVLTVNNGATLELNRWGYGPGGANQSLGGLDYNPARFVINGGTVKYTGGATGAPTDPAEYPYGPGFTIGALGATLDAAKESDTWTVKHDSRGYGPITSNAGGTLTLTGVGNGVFDKELGGSGGLIKSGSGTWTLARTNSYTGNTTVNEGTLVLADDAQLTFAVSDTTQNIVGGNGTATFNGDFNVNTSAVTGTAGGIWLLVDRANLTAESFDPVTFNVIGFTQQGDGITWTMSDAKGDWSFSEDTGELTLDVGSDYDDWVTANGVVGTETDDDDNDGLTNFEEYAFGLDPTGGSSVNPITSQLDKATKKFSYTRRATNLPDPTLTYSVWFSTDLGTWTQDTGATEGTPVLNGDVETVEVTLSGFPGDPLPGKLFIQVRAN
jgi:autotransporter-associated beta strand protein